MMKFPLATDLARFAQQQTQSAQLKTAQAQLTTELASGEAADTVRHLDGDLTYLSDIKRQITLSESHYAANLETNQVLETMQAALGVIDDQASAFTNTLIVGSQSNLQQTPEFVASEAEAFFDTIVGRLNTQSAGRHMFSGNAIDQTALNSADSIKSLIDTALTGAINASEVVTRLNDFFGPGGDFEVLSYTGSTTAVGEIGITDQDSIRLDIQADDNVFRELLKSAALAMAASGVAGLSSEAKQTLLDDAFDVGKAAKEELTVVRGALGFSESRLEKAQVFLQAERASAELARSDLLSVDSYEAATRLEDTNTRLEFLYTITARSRNLSFLEYMR